MLALKPYPMQGQIFGNLVRAYWFTTLYRWAWLLTVLSIAGPLKVPWVYPFDIFLGS